VLWTFGRRGFHQKSEGAEIFISAACANNAVAAGRFIAGLSTHLLPEFLAEGSTLLAEFAGNDAVEGVRMFLDLGVPVDARYGGDPYFDIAKDSTALHVAAWKAWPKTVKLLIERGANVNAQDAKGRTPLILAVKACVDSYWTNRRSPESVEALLKAGASISGVEYPCGYDEVDALLKSYVNLAANSRE
jgi:ankyrin repeat protein